MPKVSVIIPCYNQGQYIDEAVDSVLNQTFQDFEIIIVNDGSTDKFTNTKLENYNKPKTKVLHTKNRGVSAARNFAIKNSSGKYILPLDADDKIEKTYLEKAVNILDKSPSTTIVYSNLIYFGATNTIEIFPPYNPKTFLLKNTIHVSGLFRINDFYLTTGYDENLKDGLEDWEFWINILKSGGDVFLIEETLFYYRRYDNSRQDLINKNKNKNKKLRNFIVKKHLKYYSEKLGNPMYLCEENIKLRARVSRLESSKPYKLGTFLLKPIKMLLNRK